MRGKATCDKSASQEPAMQMGVVSLHMSGSHLDAKAMEQFNHQQVLTMFQINSHVEGDSGISGVSMSKPVCPQPTRANSMKSAVNMSLSFSAKLVRTQSAKRLKLVSIALTRSHFHTVDWLHTEALGDWFLWERHPGLLRLLRRLSHKWLTLVIRYSASYGK